MHIWRRLSRTVTCDRIFLLCVLSLIPLHAAQASRWPAIKPLERKYHFRSMQEAKLKAIIEGQDGKPKYILECYSSSTVPQTGEFMYSGDFECRLHSYDNKDYESTLLTELPDADKDWESRGRFLAEQLVAPCGDYRDLGRERSFRLRGFKLELNLSNVVFADSQRSFSGAASALKSLDLEVVVDPDPAAISSIASTPSLPLLKSLSEGCQKAFSTLYLDQFRREAVHKRPKP